MKSAQSHLFMVAIIILSAVTPGSYGLNMMYVRRLTAEATPLVLNAAPQVALYIIRPLQSRIRERDVMLKCEVNQE